MVASNAASFWPAVRVTQPQLTYIRQCSQMVDVKLLVLYFHSPLLIHIFNIKICLMTFYKVALQYQRPSILAFNSA